MATLRSDIWSRLVRLYNYLFHKRSEILSLDEKDIFMAKIVMDIQLGKASTRFISAPIRDLIAIHPVDNRETTVKSIKDRARILRAHRETIIGGGMISNEALKQYIPSISPIMVVSDGEKYYTFEGNGRVAAIREAYPDAPDLRVEVELYELNDSEGILRDIHTLRTMHHLT